MTGPQADRDTRAVALDRMTKAQLIRLYRPHCLYSANPLTTWRKDELVSALLSIEFPQVTR